MKKLIISGFLAAMLMHVPLLLTAQNTTTQKTADSGSCGVVDYGGQVYHTVIIGTQCWMKENLNIGKWVMRGQQDTREENNDVLEKYCFGDNFINCDNWGGLYEWDEMMRYVRTANAPGICPAGWHIPSSADLKTLIRYLGGEYAAGGKMKFTGSNGWQTPNVAATDSSGFKALPGGYYDTMTRRWRDVLTNAYFWSSETISETTSVAMSLSYRSGNVNLYEEYNPSALSVRCVKDK
jgi:uncharacterized protein (TIGR02145 family)